MALNSSSSAVLRDYEQTFVQSLFSRIITQGPTPKHVAVIMDGNRRYAKSQRLANATAGHVKGENEMFQVLKMIMDLKIEELTVYSFSKDNFSRTPDEIKGIIEMTISRLEKVFSKIDDLHERGIRFNAVGNWKNVPSAKLKSMFAKTCIITKENKNLTLNFAFCYSAQEEISNGAACLVEGLLNESISANDLSEDFFLDAITLHPSNPVDILIRTGGDKRLSDFILWEASNAHMEWLDCTWPEVQKIDLLKILLRFQAQVVFGDPKDYWASRLDSSMGDTICKINANRNTFTDNLRKIKWDIMKKLIH